MKPSSARHMKPSARRVLNVLLAANYGWVRGNALFEAGGTRFGARLFELEHDFGHRHEKRHDPTSALPMYRLLPPAEPEQLRLEIAS